MIRVWIILVSLGLSAFESYTRLVRVKINDELSVLLPKGFNPMDEMDFSQRYPSVRRPVAAYTNYERQVDFSVNISASQWPDANLEMAQKFFKASLFNLFDNVDLIQEGIHEVHGRQFIFFEFESRMRGNAMQLSQQEPVLNYTYIQYLVEPSRTLVFSFTCPRRLRMEWQKTAHTMMTSIKMK